MKRFLCCLLTGFLFCAAAAGCAKAEPAGTAEKKTSAVQALEDLFTTIDLMDTTIAELETEMEEGHVTSEQLTQMYLDRIAAYDKTLRLNSVLFLNSSALDEARVLDQERSKGKVQRLRSACAKAEAADRNDVYALYEAARNLSLVYDELKSS